MSHDKSHDLTTKDNGTHAQVTKSDLERREEINLLQQHHGTDSWNGEMLDCNMNEAQTPVDAMCNLNQTFGTEENIMNPWQKSWTDYKKKNPEQQCVQQCVLNKGSKKCCER